VNGKPQFEGEKVTHLDIGLREPSGLQDEQIQHQFADEENANLQEKETKFSALQVYPTPAREFINLKINRELKETAKIELISSEGEILRTIFRENASDYVHTMNTEQLRPGFYYVRVTDGNDIYFKKFVIQ